MSFKSLVLSISLSLFMIAPSLASETRISTVSVTGTGKVELAPDMAIVSVGVLREAKTAREALDENNAAMASILKALSEQGIADKDLQTSNFNIQPRYVYPKRTSNGEQKPPKIVGYVVSNNLEIRIRNLDTVGKILDQLVTLGVNSGGNIRFQNQDTTKALEEARISAVKNALGKATTLVTTAGAKLGRILDISENTSRPRPVPLAQARSLAVESDAAVPIAGGENSYSVSVNISWEIEQ